MENSELISDSRSQALKLIDKLDKKVFHYHDSYHTEQVARVAQQLGKEEGLDPDLIENLCIAAWFHDTGYSNIANHEKQSVEYAIAFLSLQNSNANSLSNISRLIMATKISHQPQSKDEEIIRDADLHYLGLENYEERAELLRLEWEQSIKRKLSDSQWYQENIKFFESHRFYTDSAQKLFTKTKAKNLEKIRRLLSSC